MVFLWSFTAIRGSVFIIIVHQNLSQQAFTCFVNSNKFQTPILALQFTGLHHGTFIFAIIALEAFQGRTGCVHSRIDQKECYKKQESSHFQKTSFEIIFRLLRLIPILIRSKQNYIISLFSFLSTLSSQSPASVSNLLKCMPE